MKTQKSLLVSLFIFVLAVVVTNYNFKSITTSVAANVTEEPIITTPNRLTVLYNEPIFGDTQLKLTASEVAQRFGDVIYSRAKIAKAVPGYKQAGFQGKVMEYLILDQIGGPAGLQTVSAQQQYCSTSQASFTPYSNSITMDTGAFCKIHDSIVGGLKGDEAKKIDHDLNPSTPSIWATEDWLLHKKDASGNRGDRLTGSPTPEGGLSYMPNPANVQMREYFIARVKRELGVINDTTHPRLADIHGIYLDNIALNWGNAYRAAGSVAFYEYNSSTTYADNVFTFVQQIHDEIRAAGNNNLIWGNFIESNDTGSDWDRYNAYISGGLMENFALQWREVGPYPTTQLNKQLIQAKKWIAQNKTFIAVAQGTDGANRDKWARYSFVASLLVTDGKNVSFYYSPDSYTNYRDYPEYTKLLGKPVDSIFDPSTELVTKYERSFECGKVILDTANADGRIEITPGCIPGGDISPTTEPEVSPTLTVTPIITRTPIVTVQPTITITPSPIVINTITPRPTRTKKGR